MITVEILKQCSLSRQSSLSQWESEFKQAHENRERALIQMKKYQAEIADIDAAIAKLEAN